MKNKYLYLILLFTIVVLNSCKKEVYDGNYDPEIVETYKNAPLDSLATMNKITNQKIQELYDLGLLYVYNNNDHELDSILSNQMENYFLEKDTTQIQSILSEIKNSKSHYIKIENLEKQTQDSSLHDSVEISKFLIKYYDKEKHFLSDNERFVKYILKKSPKKFKQEFKFYFLQFAENDSILKGVTK